MIRFLLLQARGQLIDTDFSPSVSATCKAGYMTIRVAFNQSFSGAVHARDFRTPACMTHGNGSKNLVLSINLLASPGSPEYCGVLVINVSLRYREWMLQVFSMRHRLRIEEKIGFFPPRRAHLLGRESSFLTLTRALIWTISLAKHRRFINPPPTPPAIIYLFK